MSNESHPARRDGSDVMIHPLEMEALEIGHVARNMNGLDLTFARLGKVRADDKTIDQQTATVRPVSLMEEVGFRWNIDDIPWQARQDHLVDRAEAAHSAQPPCQHVSGMVRPSEYSTQDLAPI